MTRAISWLGHPAFPLVVLGLLVAWAVAVVALTLAAPAAPTWAAGLLTFCGYDATLGHTQAASFLALLSEVYLTAVLVVWFYWSEIGKRLAQSSLARWVAAIAVLVPLLGGVLAFGSGRVAFASVDDSILRRGAAAAPEFNLVDQHDQPVTLQSLRGKVAIVTFFFADCKDTCPVLMYNLQTVLERLPADGPGRNLVALGITVDPAHDRPEVLAAHAELWHFDDPRFLLLSGEPAEVERTLDGFDVFRQRDRKGEIQHSNVILLIDQQGRLAYATNGMAPDREALDQAATILLGNK